MKTRQINHLTELGFPNSGNYCDPVTGECYSNFEKETNMTTRIDPVCKMEVDVETAEFITDYAGEKYYFCSPGCQHEFEKNPDQYLQDASHE